MLGQNFEPDTIYQDHNRWLKVKTRGPIITRGVDRPIVRLTVEDENHVMHRAKVYAGQQYRTAVPAPASRGSRLRSMPKPALVPKVARPKTELVRRIPAVPRAPRTRSRAPRLPVKPPLMVAPSPDETLAEEACYWLPLDMSGLGSAQMAIINLLSGLPWLDAPAARWSSDGALIEHDLPGGLDAVALAAHINRAKEPTWRQVHSVHRSIEMMTARGMIEENPADPRRYRLRGWQCLHTRRRTTRRAIEHGGGRAVFATVRFSA